MSDERPGIAERVEEAPPSDAAPPDPTLCLVEGKNLRSEAPEAGQTAQEALERAYRKSVAEARLLYEAGHLLGSTLDPETIFETLRKLVSGNMPVDSLLVSSFDPQTNLISCSYAWIEGSRADVSGFPAVPVSPDGRGMQSTVLRTGKPLLILDALERAMASRSHYHVDPDGTAHDQPTPQKPQTRSILMVPIKLEDRVLGVVQLQSLQERAYSEDDLRLLEALVLQMAAATRNAFLYQQVRAELAERGRTEQALRESEAKYRTLVETSNDLIWSLDVDGRIRFVNQAAQRILGYEPEEMSTRSLLDFLTNEKRRRKPTHIARFLRGRRQLRYDLPLRCKDGTTLLLAINGVVLRDEQGHVSGATGTAADVTERRRLQEQLLQAQKMESIGRLAGGIAHDFNNLMTAIIGYARLAQMLLPPENEVGTDLHRIQQAALRASELTQHLLAFARKQIIEPKVVNLNDLILDIDKMLRPLIGADVELIFLPAADAGYVRIDPGQFGQVLINLAVNARDAMPQGGKLSIETSRILCDDAYGVPASGSEGRDCILVTVRDTGVGMPPEVQAHIFEPFFTTKEVGKGTGLGLSTCYGIVQQSGGQIRVESASGQGTTFRIYLPRLEAPAPAGTQSEHPEALPRGSETLLLVEDDPMVSDMARQTLSGLGYSVLTASNGQEALRVAAQAEQPIALVITDIIMPQMGGLELAERLEKSQPERPILFMSGYASNALEIGGVISKPEWAFLQKPFTPLVLARKVRQMLDAPAIVKQRVSGEEAS